MLKKLVLILLMSPVYHASAADDAVARYKDFLPQQILALTEDERKKSVPMKMIWAAQAAVSNFGDTVTQARLNLLMYNGFADYEGAKRAFQKDLGEQPTGTLTVGQLVKLDYRVSRQSLPAVDFFSLDHGGYITADFASVKGTLKILDDRIAYPINHVVIECYRTDSYCTYRQIALTLPDENSWTNSYIVSSVANETYRVTRWDDKQIDAVPVENSTCRTNQLSFNFATKEFFEITRNNVAGDCKTPLGATLPPLTKPRVSQIVDGSQIVAAEFNRIGDEARTYYSSSFREKIEALKGKENRTASGK